MTARCYAHHLSIDGIGIREGRGDEVIGIP
jgi:hypothetical protein